MSEERMVVTHEGRVHIHPNFLSLLEHHFHHHTTTAKMLADMQRLVNEGEDIDEFSDEPIRGTSIWSPDEAYQAARRRVPMTASLTIARLFLVEYLKKPPPPPRGTKGNPPDRPNSPSFDGPKI